MGYLHRGTFAEYLNVDILHVTFFSWDVDVTLVGLHKKNDLLRDQFRIPCFSVKPMQIFIKIYSKIKGKNC